MHDGSDPTDEHLGVLGAAAALTAVTVALDALFGGPITTEVIPTLQGKVVALARKEQKPPHVGGERRVSGQTPKYATIQPGSSRWHQLFPEIQQQLRQAGVPLGAAIGQGSWGRVFVLQNNPDRVAKITADRSEAAATHRILRAVASGRVSWGRDLPGLVHIHGAWILADRKGRSLGLYLIILDRVPRKLSSRRANEIDAMSIEDIHQTKVARYRGLQTTIETLHYLGIPWMDLHSGNILVDKAGDLKIVDVGYIRKKAKSQMVPVLRGAVDERLNALGTSLIAADIAAPDPIPGVPGPVTAAVLLSELE